MGIRGNKGNKGVGLNKRLNPSICHDLFLTGQQLINFRFQDWEPLRECPEGTDFDFVVLMNEGIAKIDYVIGISQGHPLLPKAKNGLSDDCYLPLYSVLYGDARLEICQGFDSLQVVEKNDVDRLSYIIQVLLRIFGHKSSVSFLPLRL